MRHLAILAEKAMAPHSSTLAWRIPGTEEPGGLPSMGSHRVGHDWSDLAAAAAILAHFSLSEFWQIPSVTWCLDVEEMGWRGGGLTELCVAMVTRHPIVPIILLAFPFLDRPPLYSTDLPLHSCSWFWRFLGKAIGLGQDEDDRMGTGSTLQGSVCGGHLPRAKETYAGKEAMDLKPLKWLRQPPWDLTSGPVAHEYSERSPNSCCL